MKRLLICLTLTLFCGIGNSSLTAQDELPEAKKVLAKFVEATGGKEKYKSVKNMAMTGKISIVEAGISGDLKIFFALPNKFHFDAKLGPIGKVERGSDGKTVWENTTLQGARLIEGAEARQALDELDFASILNPEKKYKSMKTVGVEEIAGEKCYQVDLVKKDGSKTTEFYSVKSGLKISAIQTVVTPMGDIKVQSFDSNYKESKNGIKLAWTSEQKLQGITQKVEMTSVQFNIDIDKKQFALPEEVQDLID